MTLGIRVIGIAFVCWASLAFGADESQAVVASVDGRPITMAEVEKQLIRREGAEAVTEIAKASLANIDWSQVLDDKPILTLPTGSINRLDLLKVLMPIYSDGTLEELISIAVVRQALAARGLVIDEAMIRGEVQRAESKLAHAMKARGMPAMDLNSFLKESKSMNLADYVKQPGFRVLIAGLHALVRAEAVDQVGVAELEKEFNRDPDRFVEHEAVDCSIIYIPYRTEKNEAGDDVVTDVERDRLQSVVDILYGTIFANKVSFETTFAAYARSYDPDAGVGGRIGWVRRDGQRSSSPARQIPEVALKEAFAAKGPYPQLLQPIAHDTGIELIRVHGWRPERRPTFDEVRDQLAAELVEADLDQRSRTVLTRLRQAMPAVQRDDGALVVGNTTLRASDVETAVLIKEGAKAGSDQLLKLLDSVDWVGMAPDATILSGRGWSVERPVVVARLLERSTSAIREDLIGIELLRGAVLKAGIVVDSAMVEKELNRLERAYRHSSEAAGRDFPRFVLLTYGASLADLRLDPSFRVVAGCGELLRRQSAINDVDAEAFFLANRRRVYRQEAGADCSIIFMPHRAENGIAVSEEDRARSRKAAQQMYDLILAKPETFADFWQRFGARVDPFAVRGRVGWVPKDGTRTNPAARVTPPEVVAAAFAATPPFPRLLPPVEHAGGIDLVMVHGQRTGRDPSYQDIADTVKRDLLEAEWDGRLQAFVDGLRRDATITYADLPPLIRARSAELTALVAPMTSPDAAVMVEPVP